MSKPDDEDEARRTIEIPAFTTVPPARTQREQLFLLVGDDAGRAFEISGELIIGRAGDCDVMFAAEDSVSRRHARIARTASGTLEIVDLGSRNGTFVNGMPVLAPTPLAIGDRIQIGARVVLLLTHEDPLKDLLRERQKMEAIGRMASGVAHDFNNVVCVALAACDNLAFRLQALGAAKDAEVAECLTDLRTSLERGTDLTRSIATLGRRKGQATASLVDVGAVCEEVARLCERSFGPTIRIHRRTRKGLMVRAYRTELHQILLNLCVNARDAMPKGGSLRIAVEQASGTFSDGLRSRQPWVLLRVADTGTGMSNETRERLFEPFFTTKREGKGTGLGLATVLDLVKSMKGRIEVESKVGAGTVFLVWLPAAIEQEAAAPRPLLKTRPPLAPVRAPGEARHVLVVDEEPTVRRSLLRSLTADGYSVVTASDGAEALRVFATASPRPSVVILDLDMSGMSGEKVLEHLVGLDARLRVVVVSGYWDPDRRVALLAKGAAAFVAKPFDVETMRAGLASLYP